MQVLELNADYTPLRVLRWERAIELILDQRAVTVADFPGRFVRSPSLAIPWPAVIALKRYSPVRLRVRFGARAVFARDGYACAYCGRVARNAEGRLDRGLLTLDHVVPRAQAKDGQVWLPWARAWRPLTCWENVISACAACNLRKADRTPAEAGMALRVTPRVPTPVDALRITLGRVGTVPAEWEPWLPERWRELPEEAQGEAPDRIRA